MTLDPNLDWLANDEGDLRPEALRAIEAEQQRVAAARSAAQGQQRPAGATRAAQADPRPAQRPAENQIVRPSAPPAGGTATLSLVIAAVLAVAVVSGLIGALTASHLARGKTRTPSFMSELPTSTEVTLRGQPTASVTGINVNLRTGPGIGYPVAARLMPGEDVVLRGERNGWFAASTLVGASGWVFGAYLRGSASSDRGAAVITETLTSDGFGAHVVLRPGDRVFVARNSTGQYDVILPTGRRLRVPAEALSRVD